MTVNELARSVGVAPGKVRYYARRGLLPAARDTGNGYRCFDAGALARLHFIATTRALGFPIRDIARLLGAADAGRSPCPQVRTLLDARIAGLAEQRRALKRDEMRMKALAVRWAALPDGVPDARRVCPLIAAVSDA